MLRRDYHELLQHVSPHGGDVRQRRSALVVAQIQLMEIDCRFLDVGIIYGTQSFSGLGKKQKTKQKAPINLIMAEEPHADMQ